jgi:hypothetical protein
MALPLGIKNQPPIAVPTLKFAQAAIVLLNHDSRCNARMIVIPLVRTLNNVGGDLINPAQSLSRSERTGTV